MITIQSFRKMKFINHQAKINLTSRGQPVIFQLAPTHPHTKQRHQNASNDQGSQAIVVLRKISKQ